MTLLWQLSGVEWAGAGCTAIWRVVVEAVGAIGAQVAAWHEGRRSSPLPSHVGPLQALSTAIISTKICHKLFTVTASAVC